MRYVIVILALTLLLAPVAKASQTNDAVQSSRDEMIRILGNLPSVMPIREDLSKLGFRGDNLELAVTQAGAFYKDPDIAGHIADRVIAAYTDPAFQVEAQGLVWPLIERGMGHLSTGEMRFYYAVEQAMINALSNRECGLAVRGRLSDSRFSDAMTRVTARLDSRTLREFYRVELKAARMGAAKQPVRLSERELLRIAGKVEDQLFTLIDAAPDAPRLRSALKNIESVDNTRACRVGRMFYQAVMSLNQNDLRSGLLYLGQP